jgi:hypothetical protein
MVREPTYVGALLGSGCTLLWPFQQYATPPAGPAAVKLAGSFVMAAFSTLAGAYSTAAEGLSGSNAEGGGLGGGDGGGLGGGGQMTHMLGLKGSADEAYDD